MKKTNEFVSIVVVGFIVVLAVAMALVAFYYQGQKNEQDALANTVARVNTHLNTHKIACNELRDETSCKARAECAPVEKCSQWSAATNGAMTMCAVYSFEYCVPLGCEEGVSIKNFSECEQADCPIQKTYPRTCSAGGKTFTEVITNSNTSGVLPIFSVD